MQVTIGIPSYNEEGSIRNLLEALELQTMDNVHKIGEVIISDDSTDATPDVVNDFTKKSRLSITLIHHNMRKGAASAWNEIFSNARGDAVVLYDADVIPDKDTTLLLSSGLKADVALCASNPVPLEQNSIAARASSFTASWLRRIRKLGLSQYTVMGRGLSIRADIARMIKIPDLIAIDLYLQCKVLEQGYKVGYCDDAIVWFKPAGTMLDFASQVSRAVEGHEQIKEYVAKFGIRLPLSSLLKASVKEGFSEPKGMAAALIAYLALPIYRARIANQTKSVTWHVASSTKGIRVNELYKQKGC
ncbi:MAG: glycosyltransferase family 2 protein [Nitrososphaerales archaeon]